MTAPVLQRLHLESDAGVLRHRDELLAMITGGGAYLPLPSDPADPSGVALADALAVGAPIDQPDVTLVIATSGSTGTPKGALHTAPTLTASAAATERRLGGPGNWLLALPPHHIAGLQVLLRALGAGFVPQVLDLSAGFDLAAFATAAQACQGPRRYTSLVPTQLHKVLQSPSATAVLAGFDAVLVGGAATPEPLQRCAVDAGVAIVSTYGMSETAGGCVYDGRPIDGVDVRLIDDAGGDVAPGSVGRIELGGPMVARGYRRQPEHPAFAAAGRFLTDDLGRFEDGELQIIGRVDDAISTGGLTVSPQAVEAVLSHDPRIAACAVVGVADHRLGQKVVAVVVPAGGHAPTLAELTRQVGARLDRYAAPRELLLVDELPMRGPGKVDRRALRARLEGLAP